MLPLLLVLAAVLGLAVGSFLNVVIHRVPRGESLIRPGSHCPRCGDAVRPRHNVPVFGWLALRGKCATCKEPISARYPLVEVGTALLFAAITARFGWSPELPAYLYLASIAVALAMIDLDVQRLPDAIVLPSYLVGLILLAPAVIASGDWGQGLRALAAMAALWVFYKLLTIVRPGGMGLGDVKLAGVLGLYLGWLGWDALLIGAFAAFLIGGLAGGALLAARRANGKTAVPFGPYMLLGAFLAIFAAGPVAGWYLSLLPPA
ncbi:prepilin peptidase [Catenuloplanes indicus]|uniref:Prepilin leader peptidase/N-methyltransferase n=1 Tax=Catenuloplanes indicus TaxID=137267 RepID=A0AAE3W6K7_9ACTN|nr:A24 family peptidase [Catenuloplanes indicus]MDQ0370466.1 leader peptidase (prepilin peptidase)/N-methyltransferase [Catenuloplanes indicus]